MPKLTLTPPPNNVDDMQHFSWRQWFQAVFNRIGNGPFGINGFPKAKLPSAADWGAITGDVFSSIIFVSDEAGGAVLAFSDGTNWRRVTDRAVVS